MGPPARRRPVPEPRSVLAARAPFAGPVRRRRWSVVVAVVAGIRIRVHVTFLALVVLVAWSRAVAGVPVVPGIAWIAALFACVVVHELAHSLVARRVGVPVEEIDLLPIGGLSRLERLPADSEDERRIAVAGPLASAGLAVAFGVLALGLGQSLVDAGPFGGPWIARLAWTNLLLAGFNLLPAFPMDGGRVLRASLQPRLGRLGATRRAVQVSRWVAGGLVLGGIALDLWLAVIGAFVLAAGRSELLGVEIHEALDHEPLLPLVVACPAVLPASATVAAGLAVADRHPQPAYAVVDDGGRPVGLVTSEDLRCGDGTLVGERARPVAVVPSTATLAEGVDLAGSGLVAVVEGRTLLGFVDPLRLRRRVDAEWRRHAA